MLYVIIEIMKTSPKRRCQAMTDAGIEHPGSKEGIIFCTKHCPYDKCIVFDVENGRSSSGKLTKELRIAEAKKMSGKGCSIKKIAKALGVFERTVRMYLG